VENSPPDNLSWIERELAASKFGDKRLRKTVAQLDSAIGEPIPLACADWTNTKAAYRFALIPESWIVFGWSLRRRFPCREERRTMKASKFSDAQKAFILKQGADGMPVADLCRKAGISQATYFNWKKKYDGLLPTEMRRLKQLEDENNKLRKLVADLSLDREMLQDVIRRKL
jgi:putative transposase